MRQFLIAALFFMLPINANAQTPPASLIADQVIVDGENETITASGSVEIFYNDQRLRARSITYDIENDKIFAQGPIRLETRDGVVLLATMAELSSDMRNGIIRSARLILNRQLQIASAEGKRINGRYNALEKVIASSCRICEGSETPIWQIRAERVIHDELKRRIYFKNAYFDLFGVPIAYLPAMHIPDPTVKRASGWLTPDFSSSEIYGYGIKIPYFVTLGQHADITFTPFLTTKGGKILETEFRRKFRNANLNFSSAWALNDGITDRRQRGFIDSTGEIQLKHGFRGRFQLNVVSDRSFLQEFDYSGEDRLISFARIQRTRNRDTFDFRLEGYQSLRDEETQGQIPFLLPAVEYRRVMNMPNDLGRLGFTLNSVNLRRSDGRDVFRLGANLDFRKETRLKNGIELAAIGDLQFDLYNINGDSNYSDANINRFVPTAAIELRWPWIKTNSKATHIIEPVAQLVFSKSYQSSDIPIEDSLLPEFDETNLFALNRFPGRDASETGLRANIGINYLRYAPKGWTLGLTLGQVFRNATNDDFPVSSGLRGPSSDFVAAVSLDLPSGLRAVSRGLFSPSSGEFRRADFEVSYQTANIGIETSYIYLASDAADLTSNPLPQRQEFTFDGRYRLSSHWELNTGFRYDIAENSASSAKAGVSYGNECIQVGLSVSRRMATTQGVPSSTNIGLKVNLAGLGGNSSDNWPSRQCGSGLR